MSAARVPVVLSELCKIRSSPAVFSRNLPCGNQLKRIKRDLFGIANPAETNKTFSEELEKHQDKAIKKWGFDFRTGCPLSANSQFIWERVSFTESTYAPEMYTLTRAAHVRPTPPEHSALDLMIDDRAERENFIANTSVANDQEYCYDSQDELSKSSSLVVFKKPVGLHGRQNAEQLRKRQPKITEYMKERKRLSQTPKKFSPSKRMRSNSGNSCSTAPTTAHSIGAHFDILRNRQQSRNN